MNRWGVSLAGMLVTAGLALGQSVDTPMAPPARLVVYLSGAVPRDGAKPVPAPAPVSGNAAGPIPVPMPPIMNVADDVEIDPAPAYRPIGWIWESLQRDHSKVFTAEAEYLLWFLKGSRTNNPIASNDVLGQQTAGEIGDADPNNGPMSGGRLTLGYWQVARNPWVTPGYIRTVGGEVRFFFVGTSGANFNTQGPPDLFRPFFDLNNRASSSFLIASPGIATGELDAHGQVSIWGAEANFWKNVYYETPGTTCTLDVMAGFRYVNSTSDFNVSSTSVFNNTIAKGSPFASFAGNRLQVDDSFNARNNFFGGQVGVGAKGWVCENFSLEGTFRLAVGGTQQDLIISGSQSRTFSSGATVNSIGGLLALPSNIGTHSHVQFSQIPEASGKAVWAINQQFSLSVGFTALYWSRMLRAANQIDRSIDITQIPNFPGGTGAMPTGLGHPGVEFRQSDLWLLGISVGAEYRW